MSDKRKLILSLFLGLVLVVAIFWLIIRAFSQVGDDGLPFYQIGRDSTWYPIDLRGKENAMAGFTNDLIQEIAKEQGFRVDIFEVGPYSLFDGLNIGKYDAVLSSLTPNVMNQKRYGFSDPFYLIGPVLITKEDSNIYSVKDMSGKIMGIESGALQLFDIPEPPDVVIIPYDSGGTALENLDQDNIDGVLLDALRAYVWTEGFYKGRLRVVTVPLTDKGLRIVTLNSPDYLKWLSQFNEGLKKVKESGLYDKLLFKWELIDTEAAGGTVNEIYQE